MQFKKLQLFIFPYAGGNTDSFKCLSQLIDDRVEVITIEYPGHGSRAHEPLALSFNDLFNDSIRFSLSRRNDKIPYAILGYSMGGILAYEFLKNNILKGNSSYTFICAEISPKDRSVEFSKADNPTTELILKQAIDAGNINKRLISDKRFFNIFVEPVISDYKLLYSYRFQHCTNEKIETDVTFFYSEKDTPYCNILGWSELIDGRFDYYQCGDNHLFIKDCYKEMASVINARLDPFLSVI